jgi:hypothetical protein
MFNEGHNAALMTGLERVQAERIAELELRLSKMEKMYDKAAADLIEALDVASAYRATASTMHQEIERRNGAERRQHDDFPALNNRLLISPGPIRKGPWTDRRKYDYVTPTGRRENEKDRRQDSIAEQARNGPGMFRRLGTPDRRKSWPR